MKKLAAYLLFIVAMPSSAHAAFNFETIIRAAKECDPVKWKSVSLAKNFRSFDSSQAAFLADVKTLELPDSMPDKLRTDFSGKRIGGVSCRKSSYLDNLKSFEAEPFHEIWTLENHTLDDRYEGWTATYLNYIQPENEGAPSVLGHSDFWCIVRFEDFIKDYRAVPIDQLCKGESAQTKKKFIQNLKRLSETMRKKAINSPSMK